MPVQAVLKTDKSLKYRFASKPAAVRAIVAKGLDPKDYKFEYVYDEMRMKPASGYAERHRIASRDYNRRVRGTYIPGRGKGRPPKSKSALSTDKNDGNNKEK